MPDISKFQDQHIVSIEIENIMRLTAFKLDFDKKTGTTIFSGANGAGKSSACTAIEMAICGADAIPDEPIRNGKAKGRILLKTEDFVLAMKFTRPDHVYLELTNPEGLKYKAPRELFESMISHIGFDPIGFATMDPREQAKILIKIVNPALDLDKIKSETKLLEDERRDINRDVASLTVQRDAIPLPEGDAPTIEVSVVDLSAEVQRQNARFQEIQKVEWSLRQEVESAKTLENSLANAQREIELIQKRIEGFKRDQQVKEQSAKNLNEKLVALKADGNPAELISTVQAKIKNAESENAKVRAGKRWIELDKAVQTKSKSSTALTDQISLKRASVSDALKGAKLPIEGLSIDAESRLLFNSNPLAQCASSEQITVGMAIAAAANPKFKIAVIRAGSLLDGKAMLRVDELAKAHNLQVIIERVDDKSPAAVQIVDGSNIGALDAGDDLKPIDAAEKSEDSETEAPKTAKKPTKSKGPGSEDLFPKA